MHEVFKFEPHLHTAEISPCSCLPAAEGARLVRAAGYRGMMTADHFWDGFIDRLPAGTPVAEAFFEGYRRAAEAGEREGLFVVPGMELRYRSSHNDYLVFGMTQEKLAQLGDITRLTPSEGYEVLCQADCLILQAHPFRNGMTRVEDVHGCEVFNGHPGHDSRNPLAKAWADDHPGWLTTAGSDVHDAAHVGRAGLWTPPDAMRSSQALAAWLASGSAALFIDGEAQHGA